MSKPENTKKKVMSQVNGVSFSPSAYSIRAILDAREQNKSNSTLGMIL
jgi:hypothetical protein